MLHIRHCLGQKSRHIGLGSSEGLGVRVPANKMNIVVMNEMGIVTVTEMDIVIGLVPDGFLPIY
jgi:hypothetical protein